MSRLDDFSRQLFDAIDNGDSDAIARLRAEGAQADHPIHIAREDKKITPVFHAIMKEKSRLIEPLLGTGRKAVPLGMIMRHGMGEFDLYAAIIQSCDKFRYFDSLQAVTNCLDLQEPAIAHAMWRAASSGLRPKRESTEPTPDQIECAIAILKEGGYPEDPKAYAQLLDTPVNAAEADEAPVLFLDYLDDDCEHMYRRWFAHGLPPDIEASGMPLLHTFAMSDWAGLVGLALDAGANLEATCSYAALDRNCPAVRRQGLLDKRQPVSVVDAARETNSSAAIQVIEAHRAKLAIGNALATARAAKPG